MGGELSCNLCCFGEKITLTINKNSTLDTTVTRSSIIMSKSKQNLTDRSIIITEENSKIDSTKYSKIDSKNKYAFLTNGSKATKINDKYINKEIKEESRLISNRKNFFLNSKSSRSVNKLLLNFVIDTTGSMGPFIEGTKKLVSGIIEEFKRKGLCLSVGILGYRDYDDSEKFIKMDYSYIFDEKAFYDNFKASGGNDEAENIAGGLIESFNMPFDGSDFFTKAIILIADAPCHGEKYHSKEISDNYAYENGKIEEITRKILKADFNFFFLKIKNNTEILDSVFAEEYNKYKNDLKENKNNIYKSFKIDVNDKDIPAVTSILDKLYKECITMSYDSSINSLNLKMKTNPLKRESKDVVDQKIGLK